MMAEEDGMLPVSRAPARGRRIDNVIAEIIGERSTRVLTEAADQVLAASRSFRPDAELGRVAEWLLQQAAVQELIAKRDTGLVKLDRRLASLARGLVDAHPSLSEITTRVERIAVGGRSARSLVVIASELIAGFAVGQEPGGRTAIWLNISLDRDAVVIAAAGAAGSGPPLRLDGARRLAEAMGGYLSETASDDIHAVDAVIPCRVSDRDVSL